jgi:hypothetical protein
MKKGDFLASTPPKRVRMPAARGRNFIVRKE